MKLKASRLYSLQQVGKLQGAPLGRLKNAKVAFTSPGYTR
jgi:hypothetical protein